MRIKKGSPIYKLLQGQITINNEHENAENLSIECNLLVKNIHLSNVFILSKSVTKCIKSNFDKFIKIVNTNIYEDNGLVLIDKFNSIAYSVEFYQGKYIVAAVMFYKNMAQSFELIEVGSPEGFTILASIPPIKEFYPSHTLGYSTTQILTFLIFKKYVEAETKIIGGGVNKKARVDGVKYMNETEFKVKIYDSHYFKTIIRTGGFKVSGHFRFQPCGVGLKDRKLIWIDDFKKDGYTRKAEISKIKDLHL